MTRLRIEYAGLPAAFNRFRILHLSDLHIDGLDGLAEATGAVLKELEADVCVMTGDYRFDLSGPCDAIYPRMQTILQNIHATHGTYGILGNHDVSEIAPALEDLGVRMLVNESAALRRDNETLWIVGVDDPYDYECDDLPLALENVPLDGFKVLLAHTPEMYEEASYSGISLYLCGHTHAGQIRLPRLGALIQNADCPVQYAAGAWTHGRMRGYTSAGIGCSMLPVRFGCPPEIVLIELCGAPS